MDVNKDGILDLILGGNQYGFKPQFSRLDANYGSVLLGNKNGTFSWLPYSNSGFFVKGEVKHVKSIKNKNNINSIIAVINNSTLNNYQIFKKVSSSYRSMTSIS